MTRARDVSNIDGLLTTKGDIYAATGAGVVVRQGVGSDGQVLTANSAQDDGLEWATPAAGSMTQIATGSLSGTTVTISSIAGTYKKLYLVLENAVSPSDMGLRFNGDTSTNYSVNRYADNSAIINIVNYSYMLFDSSGNSNTNRLMTFEIPSYTNSTVWKIASFYGGYGSSGTPSNATGRWYNTSAITSLSIVAVGGSNFTGGTYTLYGVK